MEILSLHLPKIPKLNMTVFKFSMQLNYEIILKNNISLYTQKGEEQNEALAKVLE